MSLRGKIAAGVVFLVAGTSLQMVTKFSSLDFESYKKIDSELEIPNPTQATETPIARTAGTNPHPRQLSSSSPVVIASGGDQKKKKTFVVWNRRPWRLGRGNALFKINGCRYQNCYAQTK